LIEFDQYINIAFGPKIIPQDGAEKSKPADAIFVAKAGQFRFGYFDLISNHGNYILKKIILIPAMLNKND
jgi:hypothetical protein